MLKISDGIDLSEYFEYDTKPNLELAKQPIIITQNNLVPLNHSHIPKKFSPIIKSELPPLQPSTIVRETPCILCAEFHEGLPCPSQICRICYSRGHSETECKDNIQKNKRKLEKCIDIENYEITDKELSQAICVNCKKTGHIFCENNEWISSHNTEIPWTHFVEYKKLEQAPKNQSTWDGIADYDLELDFANYLQKSAEKPKYEYTIEDAILERKHPKYVRRLEQSKEPNMCCRCGGNHKLEECGEFIAPISKKKGYIIMPKKFKEDYFV